MKTLFVNLKQLDFLQDEKSLITHRQGNAMLVIKLMPLLMTLAYAEEDRGGPRSSPKSLVENVFFIVRKNKNFKHKRKLHK